MWKYSKITLQKLNFPQEIQQIGATCFFQKINLSFIFRSNQKMDNTLLNIQNKNKDHLCQKMLLKGKRRSKRAQIKESFCCQCGKIYLSFSALYLHAKNKHNSKLTTKISDEVCKVDRVQDFVRYTFYIMQIENGHKAVLEEKQSASINNQSRSQESMSKEPQIYEPHEEYFQEYIKNISSKQQGKIIKNFIKFALKQEKQYMKGLKEKIEEFPKFLNAFMQQHLPLEEKVIINSDSWKNACRFLQKFCIWMFENKLTSMFVICDIK